MIPAENYEVAWRCVLLLSEIHELAGQLQLSADGLGLPQLKDIAALIASESEEGWAIVKVGLVGGEE